MPPAPDGKDRKEKTTIGNSSQKDGVIKIKRKMFLSPQASYFQSDLCRSGQAAGLTPARQPPGDGPPVSPGRQKSVSVARRPGHWRSLLWLPGRIGELRGKVVGQTGSEPIWKCDRKTSHATSAFEDCLFLYF